MSTQERVLFEQAYAADVGEPIEKLRARGMFRVHGDCYKSDHEKAQFFGWRLARTSASEAAPMSTQPNEPVAYVPVHPRLGPLWASAIPADRKDVADRPASYPLMAVFAAAPETAAERDRLRDEADEASATLVACRRANMDLQRQVDERDKQIEELQSLLTKEFGAGWEDYDAASLRVRDRQIAAQKMQIEELTKDAQRLKYLPRRIKCVIGRAMLDDTSGIDNWRSAIDAAMQAEEGKT